MSRTPPRRSQVSVERSRASSKRGELTVVDDQDAQVPLKRALDISVAGLDEQVNNVHCRILTADGIDVSANAPVVLGETGGNQPGVDPAR